METPPIALNELSAVIDYDLLKEFLPPEENDTQLWKADWLLSKFDSKIWIINKYGYKKELRIYWNVKLPNGDRLTEKKYSNLLNTFKRLIFLVRQGYSFLPNAGDQPEITRAQQQYSIYSSLLLIIRWMIKRGENPELTGFRSLTKGDIEQLVNDAKFGRQMIDGSYDLIDALLTNA